MEHEYNQNDICEVIINRKVVSFINRDMNGDEIYLLKYNEYFNFNIITKVKIQRLYKNYIYDFTLNEKPKHRSGMCFYAYPLVDELINLYNNELSLSASIAQILCYSKRVDHRVRAFHIENYFTRIVSTWDYIFLTINEYLQTELIASRHNKEEIINEACHYKVPIPRGYGFEIIKKPMELEKQEEVRKKLKKELKVITSNSLYECINTKYVYCEDIEKIFRLYKSEPVEKMKIVRNDIVHSGNLGANFSITTSEFLSNQAMSSKDIDFNNITQIISENMKVVKDALEILNEFIVYDKIPNRKENENKSYYLHKCKCKDCGHINYYTSEIFEMIQNGYDLICLKCGSLNIDPTLNEKEQVSEPVHDNVYIDYIETLKEFINSEE